MSHPYPLLLYMSHKNRPGAV